MKNKYIAYIPSKGRADNCRTANLFLKHKVDFKIVVEPNDFLNYLKFYDKKLLVQLDDNNRGLSYARNFIKNYSKENNEDFHWQFDDDILHLNTRTVDTKRTRIDSIEVLTKIEKFVDRYTNIAAAGLRDEVFEWNQKTELSLNRLIASAVLINNNIEAKWNDGMIEDVDYCLQVLFKGFCTVVFNFCSYTKKPNNKEQGGLSFFNYEQLHKNLVAKYPGILKLRFNKKKQIFQMAPSRVWGQFPQRLISKNDSETNKKSEQTLNLL